MLSEATIQQLSGDMHRLEKENHLTRSKLRPSRSTPIQQTQKRSRGSDSHLGK